jgi:hypothetical protein
MSLARPELVERTTFGVASASNVKGDQVVTSANISYKQMGKPGSQ